MNEIAFFKEFEMTIDEQKKNILKKCVGPTLVYGKAGSGKTTLLLSRIAYLIKVKEVAPKQILTLVFDQASADHLLTKYGRMYGNDEVQIADFIHFCKGILDLYHDASKDPVFNVQHNMDAEILTLCKDMFGLVLTQKQLLQLNQKIAYCKNMLLTVQDIATETWDVLPFPTFYRAYERYKKSHKIMDRHDVLLSCANLIRSNANIGKNFKKNIKYLHIDETQELSFLAHIILKRLCGDSTQIFMVADNEQSIGEERVAFQDALLDFTETYEKATVIYMEDNYRSRKSIVEIANTFMNSKEGEMRGVQQETCEIKFKGFSAMDKMYEYALKKSQENTSELAFLYRDLAFAIPLLDLLDRNGIGYTCDEDLTLFSRNEMVTDICNFISLSQNDQDVDAFLALQGVLGIPLNKKVQKELAIAVLQDEFKDTYQWLISSSLKIDSKRVLAEKVALIRELKGCDTLTIINTLCSEFKYEQYIKKRDSTTSRANVASCMQMALFYPNPIDFLKRFRNISALKKDTSLQIRVTSIVQSRGHSYSCVCLLDCIKNVFPKICKNSGDLHEERRLFYVAITRAIDNLEFFTFKDAFDFRIEISPFIYEIYPKKDGDSLNRRKANKKITVQDIKKGTTITHATLGKGKILSVDSGVMKVLFEQGEKVLNAKLCIQNGLIEK